VGAWAACEATVPCGSRFSFAFFLLFTLLTVLGVWGCWLKDCWKFEAQATISMSTDIVKEKTCQCAKVILDLTETKEEYVFHALRCLNHFYTCMRLEFEQTGIISVD
jgi:hypothetical protein